MLFKVPNYWKYSFLQKKSSMDSSQQYWDQRDCAAAGQPGQYEG